MLIGVSMLLLLFCLLCLDIVVGDFSEWFSLFISSYVCWYDMFRLCVVVEIELCLCIVLSSVILFGLSVIVLVCWICILNCILGLGCVEVFMLFVVRLMWVSIYDGWYGECWWFICLV